METQKPGDQQDGANVPLSHGKRVQAAVVAQIKAEIASLDWSQADLAAAAGVPTSTLHRYLSGARDLPLPLLAEIARALGLTTVELLRRAEFSIG